MKRLVCVAFVTTVDEPKTDCREEEEENKLVKVGVPVNAGLAEKTAFPVPVSSVKMPANSAEVLIEEVASAVSFSVFPENERRFPAVIGA